MRAAGAVHCSRSRQRTARRRRRRRGDTCAYRVSQIFPSLFDKYRVSSRSTEPQRHENRIRETARERMIHTLLARQCAALFPRRMRTLLSLRLPLRFCFSRPRPLEGASSAYAYVEEPDRERAPRTGSRYSPPSPARGG